MAAATLRPPTEREVHERIEENDAESNREPLREGWRREKLRQGLLTGSDGYHFIRDTILRLPQPTSLPSPSSMPPTTDLIWSHPSHPDPPSTFYPPAFFRLLSYLISSPSVSPARGFPHLRFSRTCFPPVSTTERSTSIVYVPKTPFPSEGNLNGEARRISKFLFILMSARIEKTHFILSSFTYLYFM